MNLRLPWEGEGEPDGVGICLSGGGLRSASFSLGALQALQLELGLLYGPRAADHLAVVSGGAYIGGALSFNSAALAAASVTNPPPFAPGTPEEVHVRNHGRYLIDDGMLRTAWRFGGRMLANAAAATVLLFWVGVLVADFAALLSYFGRSYIPHSYTARSLVAVGLPVSVGLLGAALGSDNFRRQSMFTCVGLAGFYLCAPSYVDAVQRHDQLSSPMWWVHRPALSLSLVALVSAAAGCAAALKLRRSERVLRGLGILTRLLTQNVPRAVALVAMCFVVALVNPWLTGAFVENPTSRQIVYGVVALAIIFLAAPASHVSDVVSLHAVYRDLLSRCFGVYRDRDSVRLTVPPTGARLSQLDPEHVAGTCRFPRLLVCATANLRHRRPGSARRASQVPFVFSHDRSGLVGIPGASFETEKLEMGRARRRMIGRKRDPEISLLGVIGMAGAAVAPSMGMMTSPALRPILSLLNLRLGVWLPNPLSPVRREVVADRPREPRRFSARRKPYSQLGPGFDALVSEFFGLQSEDSRRILVTDGGHYDNLGLLTLLRARCRTIWCIDSYQNKRHLGRQFAAVARLAKTELGVDIQLDTARFDGVEGSRDSVRECFAIGTVSYPDVAAVGRVILVKLALTPSFEDAFSDYRAKDKRFPYHSTLVQVFSPDRVENYKRLGFLAASEAITAWISERN